MAKNDTLVVKGKVNGDVSAKVTPTEAVPAYVKPDGKSETPQQAYAALKKAAGSARTASLKMHQYITYFDANKSAVSSVKVKDLDGDGNVVRRKVTGFVDLYTSAGMSKQWVSKSRKVAAHDWIDAAFEAIGIAKAYAIALEADKAGPDAVAKWDKDAVLDFAKSRGNSAGAIKSMLAEGRKLDMTPDDKFDEMAEKVANLENQLKSAREKLAKLADETGRDADDAVRAIKVQKEAAKAKKEAKA